MPAIWSIVIRETEATRLTRLQHTDKIWILDPKFRSIQEQATRWVAATHLRGGIFQMVQNRSGNTIQFAPLRSWGSGPELGRILSWVDGTITGTCVTNDLSRVWHHLCRMVGYATSFDVRIGFTGWRLPWMTRRVIGALRKQNMSFTYGVGVLVLDDLIKRLVDSQFQMPPRFDDLVGWAVWWMTKLGFRSHACGWHVGELLSFVVMVGAALAQFKSDMKFRRFSNPKLTLRGGAIVSKL